jgi:hypothetical protein
MARPKKISSLRTIGTFVRVESCSQMLFNVLNRAYGDPLIPEEAAAMPFAGGIMQYGFQCGMVWGGALGAGAQAGRLFGSGPRAEAAAVMASQQIVQSFLAQNGHVNCLELTEKDADRKAKPSLLGPKQRGGFSCLWLSARYAPIALGAINAALADAASADLPSPLSCAAVTAKRLGMSDAHAVMAAGFAGGVGLSGGACGAMGVALWNLAMRLNTSGSRRLDYKDPRGLAEIERFIKFTDYEFECSTIVGRKFDSLSDHATHVRSGGCADLIEMLTTTPQA